MKCIKIHAGNTDSDVKSLEQFAVGEWASSPIGGLLIALSRERVWSEEYCVHGHFYEHAQYLVIEHPEFVPGRSLVITGETENLTVRRVEDAIRAHARASQEALRPEIDRLNFHVRALQKMNGKILAAKARAAVIAVFPIAIGAEYFVTDSIEHEFFAFEKKGGQGIFVAREIGNDFIGGVAYITNCNQMDWYMKREGIDMHQRHGLFWMALANAFVSRELNIPAKNLWWESIDAEEKPVIDWAGKDGVDRYIVKKAFFRIGQEVVAQRVVVEFGTNNLPTKAYIAASAHKRAVGLVDKHMTPSI